MNAQRLERGAEKAAVDLRRLRYFIAVCDHGGFSRASSSVGIAQPALTRQIKLLEKEIGLPLINRTGRGAEPTEEGRFLLARSRGHLDGLDELVRELRHRSSALSGQVVIGACPTIAPFFLDHLALHVRENHPNLALSVIEAYSGDLQSLMSRNKLDLALTYRPSAPRGMEATELFSERLVLVTAHCAGAATAERSLSEIGRMRLILPSAIHELRRIIDRVCSRRGVMLRPDLELDSLDAVKSTIIDRSIPYATILPYHSVTHEVAEGQLSCFPIDDPEMQRTIAVVVPRRARDSHVSAFLVDHIRRQSAALKARLDTLF